MEAQGPVEFEDLAAAKKAMVEIFDCLTEERATIAAAISEAGSDFQMKFIKVMPLLQNVLAKPLVKYGFPAGGPGIMQGVQAFMKLKEDEAIAEGMALLQAGLMGNTPSEEEVVAIRVKLSA
uniref:Protein C10 n=1 Tax=Coccolithus braarudii TaxID=221442 RepID=A0A7S0LMS8_9EUKA